MMNQFVIKYIPGGMTLNHSGWWICEIYYCSDGSYYDYPHKMIKKADY
jgi:hypothetical protein